MVYTVKLIHYTDHFINKVNGANVTLAIALVETLLICLHKASDIQQ